MTLSLLPRPLWARLCAGLCALLPLLPTAAGAEGTATVELPGPLFAHPDPGARRVAELHRRSTVRVLDTRRDWVQVEADGGRQGWVRENALSIDTPAGPAAAPPPGPAGNPAVRPRALPRTANHALILGSGDDASAIARLLGVPDTNVARLPAPRADLPLGESLQRAIAAIGADGARPERVFIHAAGRLDYPAGGCKPVLRLGDGQAIAADEVLQQAARLARRADQVFVVIDGARSGSGSACEPTLPGRGAANLLYIGNLGSAAAPRPVSLSDALLACLDGRAPRSAAIGLANGDELARCARSFAESRTPQSIAVAGNPALIPALLPLPAAGPVAPRTLLQALHAQRSPQRALDVQRRTAGRDTLALAVQSGGPAHLYVLAASESGFALLHPAPGAPDQPVERASLVVPARDADGARWTRLLVIAAEAPRNFLRAGFARSGEQATAPADARTLRDLPLEILGGDSDPRCGSTWPAPPRCRASFAAVLLEP